MLIVQYFISNVRVHEVDMCRVCAEMSFVLNCELLHRICTVLFTRKMCNDKDLDMYYPQMIRIE